MQKVLRLKTTVLPGGRIEIVNSKLHAGEAVDVVVHHFKPATQRSAVEVLNQAPGRRIFSTAADVKTYIQGERTSWGR